LTEEAEEWRPVLGYEGIYEVSDLGRVRRIAAPGRGRRPYSPDGTLSPAVNNKGYLVVGLYDSGKRRQALVHILVIEAFLGPFLPGEESNHRDGEPSNNRLVNLEKLTHLENMRHAIRTGLLDNRGVHCPTAKLSEDDVRTIRRLADSVTGKELARRFEVSKATISYIISRRTWRHI